MTTPQEAMAVALDAAWTELVADALASDGAIRDSDVKNAVKRHRPHIEAVVLAAIVPEDAVWVTRREAAVLVKALAIGAVSYDGDGWFAKDAGYDYDDAEQTLSEARDIASRLRAAQEKAP